MYHKMHTLTQKQLSWATTKQTIAPKPRWRSSNDRVKIWSRHPASPPPPHLKLRTFARRNIILFISSNQQQKNLCSRCKGSNTILPRRLVALCFAFKVPFFLSPDENSCRHCTTALFVRFPCQADSLLRAEACRSAGGEINFSAHRV